MSPVVQADLFAAVEPPRKATPRKKRRPKPQIAVEARVEYTETLDEHGRRVWILRYPSPDRMLSVNGNVYWRLRAALSDSFRGAAAVHARAAKLPVGLARVRLDVELRFSSARSDRDALNYYSLVIKPTVDGFGPEFRQVIRRGARAGQESFQPGHGLIPDDTPAHLDGPHITIGPKCADPKRTPFGEIVVTIVDLSGRVAA